MVFYRSKVTNKLLTEHYAQCISDVYGEGTFSKAIQTGILEPVENPSVIDCLRYGNEVMAILRYREIHPNMTMKATREAVRKIKDDMARCKKTVKKNKAKVEEPIAEEIKETEETED